MIAGRFSARWIALGMAGIYVLGLSMLPLAQRAHALPQSQPRDSARVVDNDAERYFVRGLTQAYLEDYTEAVSLFERALKTSPQNPAILSALSEAEAGRKNLASAIYYARKAQEHGSSQPYYYHEHARLLADDNRPREAVAVYQKLVSRFPENTEGQVALARLQKELGRPREALRHYEAAVNSWDQIPPKVYTEMLPLYEEVGDQSGLEKTLKRLVQIRRENPRYRWLLGQLYAEQHRYQDAIPVFETLLRENPNDPRLLSRLKMFYTETGQPEKAESLGQQIAESDASPDQLVARAHSIYDRAETLDSAKVRSINDLLERGLKQAPNHTEGLDLLGRIYYEQARYADATKLLQRALNQNPRDPDRWHKAASAALKADSLRRALELVEEAQLLFPGRSELTKIEAGVRLRMGDPAGAREKFEEALAQLDSSSTTQAERASLHVGLGRALHEIGELKSATEAFETALRLSPGQSDALTYFPRTLARHRDSLDRALSLARRAAAKPDSPGAAHATLGWILHLRGDNNEAVHSFKVALECGASSAWTYERFGDVHNALGNEALARRYWNEALGRSRRPDSLEKKLQSVPQS